MGRSGWIGVVGALAAGCGGHRADHALEAFGSGDVHALETAVAAADQAVDHHSGAPEAWETRGRVHLAWAEHPPQLVLPGLPQRDPAQAALESFEKAAALDPPGGLQAQLATEVPELESLLVAGLTNAVEARQWTEAGALSDQALRARGLDEKLRGTHPERAEPLERLVVQVYAAKKDGNSARAHYLAFAAAAGHDDSALAVLVARALTESGDAPAAMEFLGGLLKDHPGDEGLLRAEVAMLVAADRSGDAIAAVMKSLPSLQGSVGGETLAGDLYAAAGARELARERWEKAIALDPHDASAHLSLGRSLVDEAAKVRSEIEERSEELDQRHPPKDLVALVRSLPDLWQRAEDQLQAARSADPQSREAAAALVALYEGRIGGLDPETATAEEKRVLATYSPKLSAAKAALATLGGDL